MGRYNISEAEWKVMACLWKESGLSLKDITYRLKDENWSYSTIRTLVTRLMDKGIIDADKSSPANFKYFPVVSEKECKIEETKSFLKRVFDGSLAMLVSTLAKDEPLSKEEVLELKRIIDTMDGGED